MSRIEKALKLIEIEKALATIREDQIAALRANDIGEYKILCSAEDAFASMLAAIN